MAEGKTISRKRAASLAPKEFRNLLLAWYDAHSRDLPWRRTRDPYRVWVSEIMLQQTRVAAVIAHYGEFLRRFPTVEKLAAARQSSVLAAWSGLGYYRRARMLHAAAKVVAQQYAGVIPKTYDGWRALPGIGRYTAAAIASIAFDQPVAVVDGNVERVLQRVFGRRMAGAELWSQAESLLDHQRPGDFNQAMMELGATVCTPRLPACLTCPLVEFCTTRGELAVSAKPAPQKKREIHYALITCGDSAGTDSRPRLSGGTDVSGRSLGKIFLVQRPIKAPLMPSMWELPEISGPEDARLVLTVRHSITVTNYRVHVWEMDAPNGTPGKWITAARLPKLALTGLARKILRNAGLLRKLNAKDRATRVSV